jgi:hypothetical protein
MILDRCQPGYAAGCIGGCERARQGRRRGRKIGNPRERPHSRCKPVEQIFGHAVEQKCCQTSPMRAPQSFAQGAFIKNAGYAGIVGHACLYARAAAHESRGGKQKTLPLEAGRVLESMRLRAYADQLQTRM